MLSYSKLSVFFRLHNSSASEKDGKDPMRVIRLSKVFHVLSNVASLTTFLIGVHDYVHVNYFNWS